MCFFNPFGFFVITPRVVHGPESGTTSSLNLPFFRNQKGLESILHLPEEEQEFLNLRAILFMKGFYS